MLEQRPVEEYAAVPIEVVAEGLPVGVPAPTFALADLEGKNVTLAELCAVGLPVLLVFWKPHSQACTELLADIARWQGDHARTVTVALICCDTVEESRLPLAEEQVTRVLFEGQSEIGQAYHVWAVPSAVLVHTGGAIGSALAVGADAVRELATNFFAIPAPLSAAPVGMPFWLRGERLRKNRYVHDELLRDGSMVLYHAWRKQIMTLNATGALIWECCDGEHDLAMIVSEVREIFPTAPNIEGDTTALVRQLYENRMINPARS